MFIILGATGHVGSVAAQTLLELGEAVTVVTRDATHAESLKSRGANVAVADVNDVERMRSVFRTGRRLFLLNPPAVPTTDTNETEKATVRNLLSAIDGSGLHKIVAESTYGAQPGEEMGDFNTLYALEEGLRAQSIPHSIIRAAYYMSNWDMMVEPARKDGILPTMYPRDLKIPMVARQIWARSRRACWSNRSKRPGRITSRGQNSIRQATLPMLSHERSTRR